MSKDAHTQPAVELERKYGFKESNEDREKRIKEEKLLKWQQKLDKEDLGKLQKELDSLKRAAFLAPPQRERKRYVEKAVHDLLKQQSRQQADLSQSDPAEKGPSTPPQRAHDKDSDGEEEIFGVSIADAFDGTIDAETFVPRSVKVRRTEKRATKEAPKDAVKLAEQEILAVFDDSKGEDLDDFLDSL